jgi:transposase InsO family protein
MMKTLREERFSAIHMLRAGYTPVQVGKHLGHSESWVRKWRGRYLQEGWAGLEERSRAPNEHGRRLPEHIGQAIAQARSELEADAALGIGLKYVGGLAVRTKLKQEGIEPLPSLATIERVLRQKGLTCARKKRQKPIMKYPHLKPERPHELCQVDIVPHFLTGGERAACFNALDVVSRYPTGQAYAQSRSLDAAAFLVHVWQEIGIPHYTQVDNEGCFSGGFTHRYVLGKVVRLALAAGTELVFSPVRHPESNGYVERFHQDYNRHVWEDTYLESREAVHQQAERFFSLYRESGHHRALDGKTPNDIHHQTPPRRLDAAFQLIKTRRPLHEGRIHFIRRVQDNGTVSVLNVDWAVPNPDPQKGVWVTIDLQATGTTLSIYNAAPDVTDRTCMVSHTFPLSEKVLPKQSVSAATVESGVAALDRQPDRSVLSNIPLAIYLALWRWIPWRTPNGVVRTGRRFVANALIHTSRLINRPDETMY